MAYPSGYATYHNSVHVSKNTKNALYIEMNILRTILKLLTFRLKKTDLINFQKHHLISGIIGTWIVGMGRYWDDPGAKLLQHLGLGSVIYIFVLAALIWLIVYPLKIEKWNYFIVLTFISLTSFPAIFYAIPVELYFSIEISNTINVWFLAIVAAWRLGLLYYFLKEFTELSFGKIFTITMMPICLIISLLTALNLHRVVFNIMGGVRNPTPHDSSYVVLLLLTTVSIILIGPLIIAYIIFIYKSNKNKSITKKIRDR